MYTDDLSLLCCPLTAQPLELVDGVVDADGEIMTGKLRSVSSGQLYPVCNGIQCFVTSDSYISPSTGLWGEKRPGFYR